MEYSLLSYEEKIGIINERILNLEKHIFHIELLIQEGEATGSFDEEGLEGLGSQITAYIDQVSVLKQIKQGMQSNQSL
jgi:hypothetical protein